MNVKNTVVTVVIFGAGVGTGWLICKKILTERYKIELAEVKEFYSDRLEEMGVMPSDFEPEDLEESEEEEEDVYYSHDGKDIDGDYTDKIKKYSSALRTDSEGKGRPIIKYNKPPLIEMEDWGDIEEDEELPDEEEIDLQYEAELAARAAEYAKRKTENQSNGLPYVIDFNEYEDGPEEYERIHLYYYTKDRMICEDDDSEVEDEEGVIGFDYEDILDMQTTAWVRNDILETLYEIHRIDDSYQLAVLGLVETPKEREYRIMGRRKQGLDE